MTILPNSKKRHKLPIQANRWNSSRHPKTEPPRADPVWIVHGENDDVCTMHRENCGGAALLRVAALAQRFRGALHVLVASPAVASAVVDAVLTTARIVPGRFKIWSETRGFF
ncbi:hypothetical protein [Paraburkholderia atlantica]|uniref:hypothetical protein n=1 Tax=Paraburkholderia atlantica TaxID=2654982 RepID=UPI00187DD1C8|nr:hypothetical protein [Paraburkholderia atlantica]